MTTSEQVDNTIYKVFVNHEEQYSIWPVQRANPPGWNEVGKSGTKAECLAYIKEVWTDMRPLSLRKKMEVLARNPPSPLPPVDPDTPREKTIVHRLCEGDHSVAVGFRAERNAKLFKEAIDRGYVHIKFTQTHGGTELGIRLDRDTSDFSAADFEHGKGIVHVEGNLTLDYVKVRCIADVDLTTFTGRGRLAKVEAVELASQ